MGKKESQELTQLGLAAARGGDREKAADLLKQAVEEDSENIDAWETLARVVDDVDEKRIALTTILQLDPNNEYAREQLGQADAAKEKAQDAGEVEVVPGITRREARNVGVGLALFTLILCSLVFVVTSSHNQYISQERANFTRVAVNATGTRQALQVQQTQDVMRLTEEFVNAIATATAQFTPPTSTPRTPDLPPTFTPSPTATERSLRQFDPPPASIRGRMVAWGGNTPLGEDYLEMRLYTIAPNPSFERIGVRLVQFPDVSPDGSTIAYMGIRGGSQTLMRRDIQQINGEGEILDTLWQGQGIFRSFNPKLSQDGNRLVFAGENNNNSFDIYVYDFTTSELIQITNEEANYTTPTISPDGTRIIAVRDAGLGPDLVVISIANLEEAFTPVPLTTDGNTHIESSPSFAPDGSQIVYQAYTTNPEDNDIFSLPVRANASPLPLVTTTANELYPVFSPDGNYIAYSSNPLETYDIMIFDLNQRQTYQLTAEDNDVFAGDWTN